MSSNCNLKLEKYGCKTLNELLHTLKVCMAIYSLLNLYTIALSLAPTPPLHRGNPVFTAFRLPGYHTATNGQGLTQGPHL